MTTTTTTDTAPPDFLTVAQTAQVFGIGRSSAYELVRRYLATDGEEGLPAIRLGGVIRVPRHRVEELLGGPIRWPL